MRGADSRSCSFRTAGSLRRGLFSDRKAQVSSFELGPGDTGKSLGIPELGFQRRENARKTLRCMGENPQGKSAVKSNPFFAESPSTPLIRQRQPEPGTEGGKGFHRKTTQSFQVGELGGAWSFKVDPEDDLMKSGSEETPSIDSRAQNAFSARRPASKGLSRFFGAREARSAKNLRISSRKSPHPESDVGLNSPTPSAAQAAKGLAQLCKVQKQNRTDIDLLKGLLQQLLGLGGREHILELQKQVDALQRQLDDARRSKSALQQKVTNQSKQTLEMKLQIIRLETRNRELQNETQALKRGSQNRGPPEEAQFSSTYNIDDLKSQIKQKLSRNQSEHRSFVEAEANSDACDQEGSQWERLLRQKKRNIQAIRRKRQDFRNQKFCTPDLSLGFESRRTRLSKSNLSLEMRLNSSRKRTFNIYRDHSSDCDLSSSGDEAPQHEIVPERTLPRFGRSLRCVEAQRNAPGNRIYTNGETTTTQKKPLRPNENSSRRLNASKSRRKRGFPTKSKGSLGISANRTRRQAKRSPSLELQKQETFFATKPGVHTEYCFEPDYGSSPTNCWRRAPGNRQLRVGMPYWSFNSSLHVPSQKGKPAKNFQKWCGVPSPLKKSQKKALKQTAFCKARKKKAFPRPRFLKPETGAYPFAGKVLKGTKNNRNQIKRKRHLAKPAVDAKIDLSEILKNIRSQKKKPNAFTKATPARLSESAKSFAKRTGPNAGRKGLFLAESVQLSTPHFESRIGKTSRKPARLFKRRKLHPNISSNLAI